MIKKGNRIQFIYSFIVIAVGLALPKLLHFMQIPVVWIFILTPVLILLFLLVAIYIYQKLQK